MVYLDRCGSLTDYMLSQLGDPFTAALPTTRTTEQGVVVSTSMDSAVERIHIEFGTESLRIQQMGLDAGVARIEQVASLAWDSVAHILEVRTKVVRSGVRFWLLWPKASDDEAEECIRAANLFCETPVWRQIFGEKLTRRSFVGIGEDGSTQVRTSIAAGNVTSRKDIPESLQRFCPEHAVLCDIDWSQTQTPGFKLDKNGLKEFVRRNWTQTRDFAKKLGATLQ
jgi:hypothetical protein